MEGKAFLEIAQKLAQMRSEPALRSAVSRAYYAAYNCCVQLINELGFKFEKGAPTHARVAQYLSNTSIDEIIAVAESLILLRKRRNQADYNMRTAEFQNHITCQLDLANAQMIISQIEKYSHEPFRTHLRNGLSNYHAQTNP